MRPPRSRRSRVGLAAAVLAFAVVALLVNVPLPAHAAPSARPSALQPAAGLTASVTWNGVNINTLGSASSALSIDFSQSASLVYNWSGGAAAGITINDARLQMYYFGFAVSTRDVTLSIAEGTGSANLDWTPLSIDYVLEGVYRLTASLIAPNGTTMWSENFYVRGNAPFGILAVIPIVLLIIAVYEIYALVRSGRYAMLGRKGPPPSSEPGPSDKTAPAAGGGAAPASSPPTETPTETPAESTAETPPPSGGTS